MARPSIDIIVPVDTRRNIFPPPPPPPPSLSFHAKRCNRVFPHHDTLKRCQVLDDGHSRFHDRGTPDDRTLSIIAVPSSPSPLPTRLLLCRRSTRGGISHARPLLQHFFSSNFSLSIFARIRDGKRRVKLSNARFSFQVFLTVAFLLSGGEENDEISISILSRPNFEIFEEKFLFPFLFQLLFYFSMSEKNMYSHCSNIIFGKEEKRNVKFIIASSH